MIPINAGFISLVPIVISISNFFIRLSTEYKGKLFNYFEILCWYPIAISIRLQY